MLTIDDIQAKIFEIQYLRQKMEKEIQQKRQELFSMSKVFSSYFELYHYGKAMTSSNEEFNEMMLSARDEFFSNRV